MFRAPHRIAFLFLVVAFGVWGFIYFPRHQAEVAKTSRLTALLSPENSAPPLGERIKSSECRPNGALPDPGCTPGAVFEETALEVICASSYTKTVRSVSEKMRKQVYAEYGVPYPQPRGSYEVDHLIPLALGGSNDIANLWAEPAEPAPGFREKDVVEVFLREEVCAGRADLRSAERQIASDWLAVYKNLTEDQIKEIKSRYRNWSN